MANRRKFKGVSKFGMFRLMIDLELNNIKQFIEEISQYIESQRLETELNYESALQSLETYEEFNPLDSFEDEFYKYNEIFPKHYYNPLLLSLYGLFENWLKRLCDLDSMRDFSKVTIGDLAGNNYIEKSRKYLEIVAEINLDGTEKAWNKIRQIQKIRNAIAHHEANIRTNKSKEINEQELYHTLKSDKRIELNEIHGSFFIKDKEFLIEVIQLIRDYLNVIIEKLSNRKVLAKNTTMPHNNAGWGQEKLENIIEELIGIIELIEKFEKRTDEFRETDFKENLNGTIYSIMYDATKVYSFFSDSHWETTDRELVMKEKKLGFEKLKEMYKK